MTEEVSNKEVEETIAEKAKNIAKDLKDKIKEVSEDEDHEEEILKLKASNAELQDKLLRSIAEIENVRRRSEKQLEDAAKYSVSNFAKALLPVMDNLVRAAESIPEKELKENKFLLNINDGVDMTKKEFVAAFSKFDVKQIKPEIGDAFDYNFHQAVAHVDSEDYESGKIINVMQDGYKIHDRLLRPAMVAVAK